MTISSQVIPAVVLLIANLMSGKHTSLRWETVTAIFGWTAGISFVMYFGSLFIAPESSVSEYLFQAWAFCLLTALARDYEKILRSLFHWNR